MCEKHYKLIFVMECDTISRSFKMSIARKKAPFIPHLGDILFMGNGLNFYVKERIIPVSMDVITINLGIDAMLSEEKIAYLMKCGWREIGDETND